MVGRVGTRAENESEVPTMRTLQELRRAAGLTQLQLAARLDVTPGTIHNWEKGKGEPRARQIAQLAEALGVKADDVLAGLPEPMDEVQGKMLAAA